LHLCAQYNKVDIFLFLAQEFELNINCVNNAGETPLMVACREGKFPIVQIYFEEFEQKNDFDIN